MESVKLSVYRQLLIPRYYIKRVKGAREAQVEHSLTYSTDTLQELAKSPPPLFFCLASPLGRYLSIPANRAPVMLWDNAICNLTKGILKVAQDDM